MQAGGRIDFNACSLFNICNSFQEYLYSNGAFNKLQKRGNFFEKTLDKRALIVYNRYCCEGRNDERNELHRKEYGGLAQLGEHLPYKQRVTGSSPVVPISQ